MLTACKHLITCLCLERVRQASIADQIAHYNLTSTASTAPYPSQAWQHLERPYTEEDLPRGLYGTGEVCVVV